MKTYELAQLETLSKPTIANNASKNCKYNNFAISFRYMEVFDGIEETSVKVVGGRIRRIALPMCCSDLQALIFANKSLRGIAKLNILSGKHLNSWDALKSFNGAN